MVPLFLRPWTQQARLTPIPGWGEMLPGGSRLLQKGVQDTLSGFLIPPLATPPDLPAGRSAEHSRLKCEESTDFISVLSSFFMP